MCLSLSRTAAVLFALAVSAGALLLIHAGLDIWKVDQAVEKLRREDRRKRDLQDEADQLNLQIEACNAVAAALIDDQMAFAVAVDEVHEITHTRPNFVETLLYLFPDVHTHRQRIARYTIRKVQSMLIEDPSRQVEVIERLEAEYQKMVCR